MAQAHQFITACLKEWDNHFTRSVNIITQINDVHHLQFSKASIQHKVNLKERNKALYSCQQSHQYRIKQAIPIGYLKLDECMHQFFCLEQDLLLYHHYVSSQFSLLWDLGGYMNSAMESRWNHMQSLSLMHYQRLQHQLKKTLETNAPVAHDYTCAVCLDLFQEPTVLSPCRHTFCRSCIQRCFCAPCHQHTQRKRTRLADKLGIRVRPAIYCECYSVNEATRPFCRRGTCPLCRQLFTADQCSLDIKLERFMGLYFPEREEKEHDMQDNRGRVYDKIQRWSCRLAQAHETCTEDVLQNGMLLLARRSWIF
ncbi:uncharacterized protein B0P05DRAFT_115616 [Gilbertella persicaria]|uniref:uncharacterized protein n=1 Tax=Gilbertella persicaria TaxID=101096 RepID=UPI00221FC125|nr:uncharacterized protein B0P05DRAFT_115616 [Gilbertella persicaria]KAI8078276.1 hypothetical protein B0P05DRAFT_115616 [Gilbertella persicaria]